MVQQRWPQTTVFDSLPIKRSNSPPRASGLAYEGFYWLRLLSQIQCSFLNCLLSHWCLGTPSHHKRSLTTVLQRPWGETPRLHNKWGSAEPNLPDACQNAGPVHEDILGSLESQLPDLHQLGHSQHHVEKYCPVVPRSLSWTTNHET